MEQVKNLQELINQKAEKRLDADIYKLAEAIRNNPLLQTTNNPSIPDISIKNNEGSYLERKPYWFFQSNGNFFDKVKEGWLPIYIAEETKNFITKVEELDSEIQGLKNVEYVDEY